MFAGDMDNLAWTCGPVPEGKTCEEMIPSDAIAYYCSEMYDEPERCPGMQYPVVVGTYWYVALRKK
jgi:hypothetical protein